MKYRALLIYLIGPLIVVALGLGACHRQQTAKVSRPIPKVWDEAAMASFELPLADPSIILKHASSADYYRIRERKIWKSYPVYAPGKEPPNYMAWLEEQEPELVFDPTKLHTDEDWIKAGETVFDAPITFNELAGVRSVQDPSWYEKNKVPVAADGTVPFLRYVIREKGNVEIGDFSCTMCHVRVMPDGSVIKGAQGNFPFGRVFASGLPTNISLEILRKTNNWMFVLRRISRLMFVGSPDASSLPDSRQTSASKSCARRTSSCSRRRGSKTIRTRDSIRCRWKRSSPRTRRFPPASFRVSAAVSFIRRKCRI